MTSVHQGGCLCGALRFETHAAPTSVSLCHCRMCAKHTGAPFAMLAVYPAEAVSISGETYGYRSSERVDRRGCANCGATVYITAGSGETVEKIEIYIGAMDEPNAFTPEHEIFDVHRPDWLPPLAGVPTYQAFKDA
jgi:hypothetical protein